MKLKGLITTKKTLTNKSIQESTKNIFNRIMSSKPSNNKFYSQIINLLQSARNNVLRTVNQTMVLTYFEIGKMIVEEEQDGKDRAEYGKHILSDLSKILTDEFGKGYSTTNLKQMRQFYLTYSISQTLSAESENKKSETLSRISKKVIQQTPSDKFNLSWSHYLNLMRIDDEQERSFYEIESFKNNWSVRELQRQFDSALYTRLALSKNKDKVKKLSEKGAVRKDKNLFVA